MRTYRNHSSDDHEAEHSFAKYLMPSLFLSIALGVLVNCSQQGSSGRMSFGVNTVSVPVSLTYKAPAFLNLEDSSSDNLGLVSSATALFVTVTGCTSGYTTGTGASPTAITTNVLLYKGDRSCIIKLEKFTLGGATYSSQGVNAVAFSSTAAGGVATFQDTVTSSSIIKVFIASQVTSPVTTAAVSFNFTDIQSGTTNNISQTNVSTAVPLSATGQAAPNFTMAFARYVSTNVNGSGNLSFTLACGATVSGTGATEVCSGYNLTTQLDYIFIPDTYSQGTITVAQANTAFGANTPLTITAAGTGSTGTTIAAGGTDGSTNTVANGGFYTNNTNLLVTGTTPFYPSNLSYVFMIRARDVTGAQNTLSYLYFYVTLTGITQSLY